MGLWYVILLISVLVSVNCEDHDGNAPIREDERHSPNIPAAPCGPHTVPTYVIVLIVVIAILLFVIIYLVIILARIKSKIYISTNHKEYFKDRTKCPTCDDMSVRQIYRNNESTLTLNSAVIDVTRYSEPETPTRPANDIKIYMPRPPGTVQVMHKKQMDELIRRVLEKSKKTASTSMRELNELQNEGKNKPMIEACDVDTKETNNKQNNENDVKTNEVNNDDKTESNGNNNDETYVQMKPENNEKPNKEDIKRDAKEEVKTKEEINTPESVLEIEVYDTVPTPKRTTLGSNDIDSMPLYDCPPSENIPVYECLSSPSNNNMLILDPDEEYLMPLTRRDTSTYINARTSHK